MQDKIKALAYIILALGGLLKVFSYQAAGDVVISIAGILGAGVYNHTSKTNNQRYKE